MYRCVCATIGVVCVCVGMNGCVGSDWNCMYVALESYARV